MARLCGWSYLPGVHTGRRARRRKTHSGELQCADVPGAGRIRGTRQWHRTKIDVRGVLAQSERVSENQEGRNNHDSGTLANRMRISRWDMGIIPPHDS